MATAVEDPAFRAVSNFKRVRAGQFRKFQRMIGVMVSPAKAPEIGLSPEMVVKLKGVARANAPSETWVDAQFPTQIELDADGVEIAIVTHRPAAFPPGGKQTAMVRCPTCRRLHPPSILCVDGKSLPLCMDHVPLKYHQAYGASPSAVAIRRAQDMNLRVIQSAKENLPSESKADLRREIKRHLAKQAQ